MPEHNLIVWDKKTLRQMKEGNQAAVAQCYEQLSPMIYTAIYKICQNKDVANDLLHNTFSANKLNKKTFPKNDGGSSKSKGNN
jgi:DNA-directed RNA polymerase specialized sigma24 family protein